MIFRFVLYAGLCALFPTVAYAHVAVTGSDGFITGLTQPFLEIGVGIAAVATGLFLGQRSETLNERAASLFLIALVIGLATSFLPTRFGFPVELIYGLCMVAGILIAAAHPLNRYLALPIGGIGGFIVGISSAPDPADLVAIAFTTAGSLVCIAFLFLYGLTGAQWLTSRERFPWLAIVLRVIGSWIFAFAIMILALSARPSL